MRPVAAQDDSVSNPSIFSTPEKPKSAADEIEELLGGDVGEKAPENILDYLKVHYKRCLKTRHPVLHGRNLESLCSCVSANLSETMTFEQVAALSKNNPEGQFQLGRMLMFVYLPCIKQPIYNTIRDQCTGSQKNYYLMKDKSGTCQCIADRVSGKMEEYAPQHIERVTRKRPETLEPIDLLIPTLNYETTFTHESHVCIERHELGYE